jgi:hypothetical protein
MKFNYSKDVIAGIKASKVANKETNDCVVKAVAASIGVTYDTAHSFVKETFKREDRKGVLNKDLVENMSKLSEVGVTKVGTKEVSFEVMPKQAITNMYKLYGELIYRQKTVKSFLQDHKVGSYIVTVAKHAFAVVDGVLIDNEGTEYKPTRKVTSAYKVVDKTADIQLSLI